jgi:hypothetical protein
MRRTLFSIFTGLLTGFLALGVAWATTGLVAAGPTPAPTRSPKHSPSPTATPTPTPTPTPDPTYAPGERLPAGVFLVGADNESIAPIPVSEGGDWEAQRPGYDCGPIGYEYLPNSDPHCLRTFDRVWATGVDEASDLGIYARAIAISNGQDTVVFVVIDTVSWF